MAVEISSFDEYYPHPYKGGYDIALTYGEPLPHSAAICYPVSGVSSLPPSSPKTPRSLIPVEKPVATEPAPVPTEAGERTIPTLFGPEDDRPDSKLGYFDGYGESLYGVEDYWWSFSGFYPFVNLETEVGVGGWKCDAEDLRYWNKWKRAADYLFGYSQGYGERRIGVDRDGIPIYANKTLSSSAVDFQIEPARTETLGYYTDSPDSGSSYFTYDKELENYNFSNAAHSYTHHFELPLQAEVDPFESLFSWRSNYPQPYDEKVHSDTKWFPLSFGESVDEVHLPTDNELAYNAHCYEDALQVQLVEAENLHQKVRCHDASPEFFYSDPNWDTYYMHGEERNHFSFTKHDCDSRNYREPNHAQLESYWSTWSHHPGYHGISEGEVYNGSKPISSNSESFNEFTSPKTTWQISCDENSSIMELEPFKPTWMQNPNYYEAYEEISSHWKQMCSRPEPSSADVFKVAAVEVEAW